MAEVFFRLSPLERQEILDEAFNRTGKSQWILEKDLWLVWTLDVLFKLPGAPGMTFKGGTALSKVFGVIERFSEDADISVNFEELEPSLVGQDLSTLTNSQLKRIAELLKEKLKEFSIAKVVPHLQGAMQQLAPDGDWKVTVDETGECVRVHFPSVARAEGRYTLDHVLIELGGRNPVEPSEQRLVTAELAEKFPEILWPVAEVRVLSPTRTFWEKLTLIHVECNAPASRNISRKFRHWFDLVKLAKSAYGHLAMDDLALLRAVVSHKKLFFNTAYANYDACLAGRVRIVPEAELFERLRHDYDAMVREGMFFNAPPAFQEIMGEAHVIEAMINERIVTFMRTL